MKLLNLTLLRPLLRLVKATERIAGALERAFPPPTTGKIKEPTDGVSIVTNEVLLEEEVRESLRLQGYMPDDIEQILRENESALEDRLDG